jgi:hypothetical protein
MDATEQLLSLTLEKKSGSHLQKGDVKSKEHSCSPIPL